MNTIPAQAESSDDPECVHSRTCPRRCVFTFWKLCSEDNQKISGMVQWHSDAKLCRHFILHSISFIESSEWLDIS